MHDNMPGMREGVGVSENMSKAGNSLARRNRESFDLMPRAVRRWASPLLLADGSLMRRLRSLRGGPLLDVGCGAMPHREVVTGVVRYDGLDITRRTADVRYESSVTDMHEVPSDEYEFVLCTEVLEHIDQPQRALAEMYRVLQPGGQLVLTVPFLSRLHEEPHDYYRYTTYGLQTLLAEAGFLVDEVEVTTSLAGFLGHQLSSIVIAGTAGIPILRWVAFAANAALVVLPCRLADLALIAITKKFPANYLVAASKPLD